MSLMPDQRPTHVHSLGDAVPPTPASSNSITPSPARLRADLLAWSELSDRASAASWSRTMGPMAVSAGIALVAGAIVGRSLGSRSAPRSGSTRLGITAVRLALAAKAVMWVASNISKFRR